MRYLYAVVCPPLALMACGRRVPAVLASVLFLLALTTAHLGLGVAIDFILILWAIHTVGDEHARMESRGFVASVSDANARQPHF